MRTRPASWPPRPWRSSQTDGRPRTTSERLPASRTGRRPTRSESRPSEVMTASIATMTITCSSVDVGLPRAGLAVLGQRAGEVGRHVAGHHVVGDVPRHDQAARRRRAPRRWRTDEDVQGAPQRHRRQRGGALHELAERRGVLEAQAQVDADDPQGQGEQERQPPAPGEQGVVGQEADDGGAHAGAERVAGDGAELQPAPEQAAPPVRGVLRDQGERAGVLAAGREPLQHADRPARGPGRRRRARRASG